MRAQQSSMTPCGPSVPLCGTAVPRSSGRRCEPGSHDALTSIDDASTSRALGSGLDPAECRIWWGVLDGDTITALARRDGISRATLYRRLCGDARRRGMVHKSRWVQRWWDARCRLAQSESTPHRRPRPRAHPSSLIQSHAPLHAMFPDVTGTPPALSDMWLFRPRRPSLSPRPSQHAERNALHDVSHASSLTAGTAIVDAGSRPVASRSHDAHDPHGGCRDTAGVHGVSGRAVAPWVAAPGRPHHRHPDGVRQLARASRTRAHARLPALHKASAVVTGSLDRAFTDRER